MDRDFRIRRMQPTDLARALLWAKAEGWNPGTEDEKAFFAADSEGFFVGELGGEAIGCISLVKYSPAYAFLGLYIVRPEFRAKGYGIQIWNAAMEYAGGALVGLDGVVAQQENYKKSGFRLAYRNIRFELANPSVVKVPTDKSLAVVPYEPSYFGKILELDRKYFPADREAFLRAWLAQKGGAVRVAVREGELEGYGMIRKAQNGHKTGPLFSARPESAEAILASLCASAGAGPVYLDVPEPNPAALALAEKYAMKNTFETARMYTGSPPEISLEGIYGVTTFELG